MKTNREDSGDVSATQVVCSCPRRKRLAFGDMSVGQGGYVDDRLIHFDGKNYWCLNIATVIDDVHPSEYMYVYIERREGGYSMWIPEFGDSIRTAPSKMKSLKDGKMATKISYIHISPGLV